MTRRSADPWQVEPMTFSEQDTLDIRFEYLVRHAILAPSSHNSQPWHFRIRDNALELLADRTRALIICDPQGRELAISCGAALQFARLAARNAGKIADIALLPDPSDGDLLARIRLNGHCCAGSGEHRRFSAIAKRRTSRGRFTDDPVVGHRIAEVAGLARAHNVRFDATNNALVRERIASLVARGERQQMADPRYRAELADWIRSRRSARHDGMSMEGFGVADRLSGVAAGLIRLVDPGPRTAARQQELVADGPWLGLLSTQIDDATAWLHTGMALADIILELTGAQISCSYFSQPIEIAELRPEVSRAFGTEGFAQILFRMGRSKALRPAARRAADQVATAWGQRWSVDLTGET